MKCRVCECTAVDACVDSCFWVEPDLCSTCATAVGILGAVICDYLETAGPHDRDSRSPAEAIKRLFCELQLTAEAAAPAALVVLPEGRL